MSLNTGYTRTRESIKEAIRDICRDLCFEGLPESVALRAFKEHPFLRNRVCEWMGLYHQMDCSHISWALNGLIETKEVLTYTHDRHGRMLVLNPVHPSNFNLSKGPEQIQA